MLLPCGGIARYYTRRTNLQLAVGEVVGMLVFRKGSQETYVRYKKP